jgi:hypothetical protein
MNKQRIFQKITAITISFMLFLCTNSKPVLAAPEHIKTGTVNSSSAKWNFKRVITIENRGVMISDAAIQIQFNSIEFDYTKAKADGSDIRFSISSGNIDNAGLSYWIEQWNDIGITRIWVKVPILKAKAQNTILMYYGNSGARPVSNGNNTFLFFDDFEDGDYSKKWNNVSIGEVVEQGGMLKLKETDGQDGIITANFNVTGKMLVRTRYQRGGADQH